MSGTGAFGARLKKERESRGVSLDELSRSTKIRRVFLEALEEERWEEMPGRVFVVGYLRAVAGHLRLDAPELTAALEAAWPGVPQTEPHPTNTPPAPVPVRAASWPWVAGAAAVLGLALLFVLLRPSRLSERKGSSAPGPAAEAPSPVVPPLETPPAAGTAVAVPLAVAPHAEPAPPPRLPGVATPPAGGAVHPPSDLFIEVSAPCWMELYGGGRRLVYRQVQPGEHLSFDGAGYSLTLGDATAARVYWKGAPIALPAEPGKVVRALVLGEESR